VLTLTASGAVDDYSDTTALQRSIAASAGVDPSSVVITVAAASVIITATIIVPTSSAAEVQTSLSSSLGTVAAASAALGITVQSDPTVTSSPTQEASSKPNAVLDVGPSNVEGDSGSSSIGPAIGGAGEQNAPPPCNPQPARPPPAPLCGLAQFAPLACLPPPTVGGLLFVAVLVGVVYIKKKAKKPPASAEEGQKQVGVTLTGPVESADESKI